MSCTRASASTKSTFKPSCAAIGARDLRNFNGVREPVAKMVGVAAGENLGLGFQPAKRPRMDYPVAVALKIVAIGMGGSA